MSLLDSLPANGAAASSAPQAAPGATGGGFLASLPTNGAAKAPAPAPASTTIPAGGNALEAPDAAEAPVNFNAISLTKAIPSSPQMAPTTPASLYDQQSAQTSKEAISSMPAPDFGIEGSTPSSAPSSASTAETLKGMAQGLARIPAEFAISAGQAGLSISDLATGRSDLEKTDAGVPTTGASWLLGDQPIKGYGSQILDLEQKIKASPFAQETGLADHAQTLAFAGVVGGETLNFVGAGGEDAALDYLAKTTDIAQTTKILRTIGVSEDLLPTVAPKIAQMSDPAAIKDALTMVDNLQKTTKLNAKVISHVSPPDLAVSIHGNKFFGNEIKDAIATGRTINLDSDPLKMSMGVPDAANHAPFAQAQQEAFKKALYLPENKSPNVYISVAGPATGKTEVIGKSLEDAGGIYLQGTGANYDRTVSHFEEAVKAGKSPVIVSNVVDPIDAWEFANKREAAGGHVTSFEYFMDRSKQAQSTLKRLIQDGYPVRMKDSRGLSLEASKSTPFIKDPQEQLAILDKVSYDESHVQDNSGASGSHRQDIQRSEAPPQMGRSPGEVEPPSDTVPPAASQEASPDLVAQIAASKDPATIAKLLEQTGVDPAEIPAMSAKLAAADSPAKVEKIIEGFDEPPKTSGNAGSGSAPPRNPKGRETGTPEGRNPSGEQPSKSSFPQDTKNKINLKVYGTSVPERVRNVIGQSEALATKITSKGQEAYLASRGLDDATLKYIRDEYQAGKTPDEIAKEIAEPLHADELPPPAERPDMYKRLRLGTDYTGTAEQNAKMLETLKAGSETGSPGVAAKVKTFLTKLEDYYDYELAADRAAGGDTPRVQNYLPQYWDLNKPADLDRFNELAKQRGISPYYGYRSQPKIFKSYAEGEAAGFKPARQNIAEDLQAHSKASAHVISRQALGDMLPEAAPDMTSMSGYGQTKEGKPFVNSNIPGLEGMSFHPSVAKLLQGYEPLSGVNAADFVKIVKEKGATAALEQAGVASTIDKAVHMIKAVPESAKEAGFIGVAASIYDHVSGPMKQVLWNFSGFHSLNITLSHMGASILHPLTGTKGVLQSVGAAASERLYNATVNSYKALMVGKDAEGAPQSVYDWAVDAGVHETRGLPAQGLEHVNVFAGGTRVIFDREIPVLKLNLAEQAARKGIVASSPEGIAVGKEINAITGEISNKAMNFNPNTVKNASRLLLAPGFTISKYKTLVDAFTKWGSENGAAGSLARQAVIGKSMIVGTAVTLGTLLATGKFPSLQQILMNFTINPSIQTNILNPKGQKIDIGMPKTYVSEATGLATDPVGYLNSRLNPLLSTALKAETGKDYYGNPLVNPNVPESSGAQLAQNLGIGYLPIGAQAVVNGMLGKSTPAQAAIQIAGLTTKVSASDPVSIKYAGINSAQAQIKAIAPDDPDRLEKMQAIFNSIPAADRKSLAYQELMAGVSTKGVYTSETEQKYFQVQALLQSGDTAGAAAITKAMTPAEYSTYKGIKTRLAHVADFQKVQSLVSSGNVAAAAQITAGMTKEEYASYQTWKKANAPAGSAASSSAPTDVGTSFKQNVLSTYPKLTEAAQNDMNDMNVVQGDSGPFGATYDNATKTITVPDNNAQGASEVFNALYQKNNIDPSSFNAAWEKQTSDDPDNVLGHIDQVLSSPPYTTSAYGAKMTDAQRAQERFSLLALYEGQAGLSGLPSGLQSFYKGIFE